MDNQICYDRASESALSADSLPVCLFENPSRLISLWEILTYLDASSLGYQMSRLGNMEVAFSVDKQMGRGAMPPSPDSQNYKDLSELLQTMGAFFRMHRLPMCAQYVEQAIYHLSRPGTDISTVVSQIYNLKVLLVQDLQRRKFLTVAEDRIPYIDRAEIIFNKKVGEAFPSCVVDIREASNCLGFECNTAAVFHLMRVAEIALRALATDRGVSYPNSSVDEQQCGALVTSLDSKLKTLREADKKMWPSESIKNEQIRFFHSVTIEFRSFNEAWRKHVCHAGVDAFYDRHQAMSIFQHVKSFMEILSVRISESSVTPEYWTSA